MSTYRGRGRLRAVTRQVPAFSLVSLLLCLPAASYAAVVTVSTVHAFNPATESVVPTARLVQGYDGYLYGTNSGSNMGNGSVYKLSTSGTVAWVHLFSTSEGIKPLGPLLQASDGNFYGTTSAGGANSSGTVFKIDSSGALTTLHAFAALPPKTYQNADGAGPVSGLAQDSAGALYGTTTAGGTQGDGTLFQLSLDGSQNPPLTTLYNFSYDSGGIPLAPLLGFDGNIYGSATLYGPDGGGSIYRYQLSGSPAPGTEFQVVYSFGGVSGQGFQPDGPLIQAADGNFWGTSASGGSGHGSVFKLTPGGTEQDEYLFTDGSMYRDSYDGLLQASDGNFYGVSPSGGSEMGGFLFMVTPAGVYTKLFDFGTGTAENGPYNPLGGLVQGRDDNLYGTSQYGGSGYGTVYKVSFSPALPTPVMTSHFHVSTSADHTSSTPAANGEGPAGVFSFNASFCNDQASPLAALYSLTQSLSGGNNLLNRSVGSTNPAQPGGPGSQLSFKHTGAYAAGSLDQGQCVTVPYQVGLKSRSRFTFTVDVLGN